MASQDLSSTALSEDEQRGSRHWSASATSSPPSPLFSLPDATIPPPNLCLPPSTSNKTPTKSMADNISELRGDQCRRAPLHPHSSTIRIGGRAGSGMGIDPHGRWGLSEQIRQDGQVRGPEHQPGTWWHRVEQRVVVRGVDFAPDTEDGADSDFEFIPASDEEDEGDCLDDTAVHEFVLETELQDLVSMDSSGNTADGLGVHGDHAEEVIPKTGLLELVQVKAKHVQESAEEEADLFGVDPDAETDDESIPKEEGKKDELVATSKKVTSDQSFEDFRLQCILNYYSDWAHPIVKEHFKSKKN